MYFWITWKNVKTDISVLEFFGYIKNIKKISMNISTEFYGYIENIVKISMNISSEF